MSPRKYMRCTFTNLESIGNGSFGKVYTATRNDGMQVAIKIVKKRKLAYEEKDALTKLHHPNIAKLYGTIMPGYDEPECDEEGYEDASPWLVMEYLPYGNLRNYVQDFPSGCPYTGMVDMARGIASGMEYLHRKGFAQEDLQARNVLVGPEWTVKICDFGLFTDEVYENKYYYKKSPNAQYSYPIRWMPPENLPSNRYKGCFSENGDIWAFGVVLFEIWSRGQIPYDGMGDKEVMQYVRDGNNPLTYTSVNARQCVKELMEECWEFEGDDRPNFESILETLNNF